MAEQRRDSAGAGGTRPIELGMDDISRVRRLMRAPSGGLMDPGSGKRVSQRVILAALRAIGEHWDGGGLSWPSLETLREMTGYSEKHLGRCFDALEHAGIVRRESRMRRADGTFGVVITRVNWGALAMWVHPSDRTGSIQQLVDAHAEAHQPQDPGSGGSEAASPADPSGPQRSEPADPRGPSQRTPEVRAEQPKNNQENNHHQSGEDAAGGGGEPGSSGEEQPLRTFATRNDRSPQGGEDRGPDGEQDSVREGEESESELIEGALVRHGVNPGKARTLAAAPQLDIRTVREHLRDAHRNGQSVNLLVSRLETIVGKRIAIEREKAKRPAPRCVHVTSREQEVEDLAGVIDGRIFLRESRGEGWSRGELDETHRFQIENSIKALGLAGRAEIDAFCDEVWAEVERMRGGELNAAPPQGAETAEAGREMVA